MSAGGRSGVMSSPRSCSGRLTVSLMNSWCHESDTITSVTLLTVIARPTVRVDECEITVMLYGAQV